MVTTNYTLEEKASGNNVPGTVSYNSLLNIATFTPQKLPPFFLLSKLSNFDQTAIRVADRISSGSL